MNWVDYLIIAIAIISAGTGLIRGFVKEVLSLVSWGIAIWVAYTFHAQVAALLVEYIATPSIRKFAAFLGLFVVTLIIGALINHFISKLVQKTGLSGTDRTLGFVFGLLRAVAIVILLILLGRATVMPADPWWQNSTLLGHFEPYAKRVYGFLPEWAKEHISFEPPVAITIETDPVTGEVLQTTPPVAPELSGSEQAPPAQQETEPRTLVPPVTPIQPQ